MQFYTYFNSCIWLIFCRFQFVTFITMRKQPVYSSAKLIDGKSLSCYTVFRHIKSDTKGGVAVKRRYVVGICLIVWAVCIVLSACSKTTYELPSDTSAIEEYIETTSVFLTDYTEENVFDENIADEDKIEKLLSTD